VFSLTFAITRGDAVYRRGRTPAAACCRPACCGS